MNWSDSWVNHLCIEKREEDLVLYLGEYHKLDVGCLIENRLQNIFVCDYPNKT